MSNDRPCRDEPAVAWTRGSGCRELAEVIGGDSAVRVDSDPVATCIETGAALMVSRRMSSFDLCSVAVPSGFSADEVTGVVAAVGSGPHSPLAAAVTDRIGANLSVPARAVYARGGTPPGSPVPPVLRDLDARFPDLRIEAVDADSPEAMVQALPPGTLLVVGAPGGSWFQRQFFGPGARIKHKASGGTVVVKAAPARVYHAMEPPAAYGPRMRVADALALGSGDAIVAFEGALVGVVPSSVLVEADPGVEIGALMVDAAFLTPEETIEHAADLVEGAGISAIPVIDGSGVLLGVYRTGVTDTPGSPWVG